MSNQDAEQYELIDSRDLVKKILKESNELRTWYQEHFEFNEDSLAVQSLDKCCCAQGVADQLLIDACERGIITKDELERSRFTCRH